MALRDQPHQSWASLLDDAYHDQAHFVRDCHRFLGMSLSAFFERQRAFFDLVTTLRRQAIGQPLQGLHPVVDSQEAASRAACPILTREEEGGGS